MSDSTIITQEIVPQFTRVREDLRQTERFEKQVLESVPEYSQVYEEDVRIEEIRRQVIIPPPPQVVHGEQRMVDIREEFVDIRRSPPKVVAQVEVTKPPPILAASTEIVPPLPKKVSFSTAVDGTLYAQHLSDNIFVARVDKRTSPLFFIFT